LEREAGSYPNASASIYRWFPAVERARAFGIVLMSAQIGGALSPLLVVPIQRQFGWRMSFYVFGAVGALWAAFWWWYRNTPREKSGVTPDELAEVPALPPASSHNPPWRILARSGSLWAIMGVAFGYLYVYYFFLFWLPTYLVRARGFTEKGLIFSTLPFVLGGAANFCGGITSDAAECRWGAKWGRRTVGLIALASASGFLLAAALTANQFLNLLWLALCYSAITFQQPTVWAITNRSAFFSRIFPQRELYVSGQPWMVCCLSKRRPRQQHAGADDRRNPVSCECLPINSGSFTQRSSRSARQEKV
jgi:MFS transporter, ACS family, glucarate transporter